MALVRRNHSPGGVTAGVTSSARQPVPLCDHARVIMEQAVLEVQPGREAEFEAAFGVARSIISASPGFVSLRLLRGIESSSRYLLLVEWETLEDHTEGFRKSEGYEEWRALLHHFYDPFPTVEHFSLATSV